MALRLAPLSVAWALCATVYIAFHDDMLSAIVARQAEMQYAYEDRLADARAELDRVASRQLLDQNSFEGKVHELLSRQATLEQRSSSSRRSPTRRREPVAADPSRAPSVAAAKSDRPGPLGDHRSPVRSLPTDGVIGSAARSLRRSRGPCDGPAEAAAARRSAPATVPGPQSAEERGVGAVSSPPPTMPTSTP